MRKTSQPGIGCLVDALIVKEHKPELASSQVLHHRFKLYTIPQDL